MRCPRICCTDGRTIGGIGPYSFCILVFSGLFLRAVPAAPIVFTLEQPNETSFQAHVAGDEWGHWTETLDGYTIILDEASEYWMYAVIDAEGDLAPGSRAVDEGAPPSGDRHLRPIEEPEMVAAQQYRRPGISYAPPIQGTQNVLVIFVDFTPSALVGTLPGYWSNVFFGGGPGCVDDFYNEASYGQLTITPAAESDATAFGGGPGAVNDGVVHVTLPYAHPNPATTGDTNRWIVYDAIVAADLGVAYWTYDTNVGGYLSTDELHIVTVVAGYEEAFGGTEFAYTPKLWAHRWDLGWGFVPAPVLEANVPYLGYPGITVGDW